MNVKVKKSVSQKQVHQIENEMVLRKGPWTVDEDTILVNHISTRGEGHWNSLALYAGLKRSGKSCRLRWLNYLRPGVRRGNITLQEQVMILELHSRWGNRWSKIAQNLPGRTDNEIKNYWRTRVIKLAKQLKCDVNSKQFRDALRYVWMPRLLERVNPSSGPVPPFSKQSNNSNNNNYHPCFSGTNSSDSCSPAELVLGADVSVQSGGSQWSTLSRGGGGGVTLESLWNDENIRFLQQQLCDEVQRE